jgi:hypothetical protein
MYVHGYARGLEARSRSSVPVPGTVIISTAMWIVAVLYRYPVVIGKRDLDLIFYFLYDT